MRDPERIPEMLDLLGEIWRQQPDLRLGQLIFNAARMHDATIEDVFSIEDGNLRKGLTCYFEMAKVRGEPLDK